jgi:hypothetical protein
MYFIRLKRKTDSAGHASHTQSFLFPKFSYLKFGKNIFPLLNLPAFFQGAFILLINNTVC